MIPSRSSGQEHLVNQAAAGDFQVAISLVRDDATTARLVLHATAYVTSGDVARISSYFDQIGLTHSEMLCPYFVQNCYQKQIALFRLYYPGAESSHAAVTQIDKVVRLIENGWAGKTPGTALLQLQALIRDDTFVSLSDGPTKAGDT